jgi:hypothetical protein
MDSIKNYGIINFYKPLYFMDIHSINSILLIEYERKNGGKPECVVRGKIRANLISDEQIIAQNGFLRLL